MTHQVLSRFSLILVTFLILGCGRWSEEPVPVHEQNQLNVLAILAADDSVESFVVVHKVLGTSANTDYVKQVDTVRYQLDPVYDSLGYFLHWDTLWYPMPIVLDHEVNPYAVYDASVVIRDSSRFWRFERVPPSASLERFGIWDEGVYAAHSGDFTPQPGVTYELEVVSPEGLRLTGSATVPPRPQIYETLPDTLSLSRHFNLSWHYAGRYAVEINTNVSRYDSVGWICGAAQHELLLPGDTIWTSTYDTYCDNRPDTTLFTLVIRVRFLDDNYYSYFRNSDNVEEISNFLLGEGSIGHSYGVAGGFGLFGAFNATRIYHLCRP